MVQAHFSGSEVVHSLVEFVLGLRDLAEVVEKLGATNLDLSGRNVQLGLPRDLVTGWVWS
mgnify:CR=1 FL=1